MHVMSDKAMGISKIQDTWLKSWGHLSLSTLQEGRGGGG